MAIVADLRGVDLSEAHLHGTSIHEARISGVLFPGNLAPEEIHLSVSVGTRMRTVPPDRLASYSPRPASADRGV